MKQTDTQVIDLKGILMVLEQELLSPQVRASAEQLDRLLAPEFVEFGASGCIYDKASIIDALTQEASVESFQIENFKIVTESDDTALVSYSCSARSAVDQVIRTSNRSSLWKLLDGHWHLVFHQGTRIA